jgi:hypothetical protein
MGETATGKYGNSVADPGVYPEYRIRFFSHPGSRIMDLGSRVKKYYGSRIRIEEYKNFLPKNCF